MSHSDARSGLAFTFLSRPRASCMPTAPSRRLLGPELFAKSPGCPFFHKDKHGQADIFLQPRYERSDCKALSAALQQEPQPARNIFLTRLTEREDDRMIGYTKMATDANNESACQAAE